MPSGAGSVQRASAIGPLPQPACVGTPLGDTALGNVIADRGNTAHHMLEPRCVGGDGGVHDQARVDQRHPGHIAASCQMQGQGPAHGQASGKHPFMGLGQQIIGLFGGMDPLAIIATDHVLPLRSMTGQQWDSRIEPGLLQRAGPRAA